jgi:hypothetical protein
MRLMQKWLNSPRDVDWRFRESLPSQLALWLVVGWNRLSFGFLNPDVASDRLSRNVDKKVTATRCTITQKSPILSYFAAEN